MRGYGKFHTILHTCASIDNAFDCMCRSCPVFPRLPCAYGHPEIVPIISLPVLMSWANYFGSGVMSLIYASTGNYQIWSLIK